MLNKTRKDNTRMAYTVVELVAAIMIVTLCIAAFAKIAHTARQQRLIGQTRQTAVDQLQNVLECLANIDPEQLAAGEIDLTAYETIIARALPEGKLTVTCNLRNDSDGEQVASNDILNNAVRTWQLDATVSWRENSRPQQSVSFSRLLSKPQTQAEPEQTPTETSTLEGGAE